MGTIRLSHQSKSYTCFTPKFSPKTFLRHSISTNSIAKDNHQQPPKMTNVMQNSAAQMGTESVMINKKEPVRLNDGNEIPQVALGVYKAPNGQETEDAVTAALEAGYRHIDSAARYMNEEACGRALYAWLKKTGTPREDVFVTTKLWDADHD